MWYNKLVLLALVMNYSFSYKNEDKVLIETRVGKFKGYTREFKSFGSIYKVRRFLGIPYAESPTGNRRFEKPEKKKPHKGIYDATEVGTACPQLEILNGGKRNENLTAKFSEDCLYLNIFTPHISQSKQDFPVMIFIHGGGFNGGFSDPYVGDILSAHGEVIVVTFNYRLNIFGFLSTGDNSLPGNYGLWDQQMAIEWVHEHIVPFGGDPELVTLFGHSAGAASVIYQSMYPGNKGLLKRIIAQSGTITCPWAFNGNPLGAARRYGALLGCLQENTESLARCVKSKSEDELHSALNNNNGFNKFPLSFIPVVDGEFVPISPYEIFYGSSMAAEERRALFAEREFMTGVVSNEGLMMIGPWAGITNDTENFSLTRNEFENRLVPDIAQLMFGEGFSDAVTKFLLAEYSDWDNSNDVAKLIQSFLQISGDYTFNIQTVDAARLHNGVSIKGTYMYFLDAIPSQHIYWTPKWATKPNHGDDLTFLFGYDSEDGFTRWTEPFGENSPEDWEYGLSSVMIKLWTNFARTGEPNYPQPVKPHIGTDWPAYNRDTEIYLNMTSGSIYTTGQHLYARSNNFWRKVLPKVISELKYARTDEALHHFCEKEGTCRP